ncbi:sporulation-specific protein 15-like isoform X2 [Leguminivora glycinivorella]|uniref:sporulation-specific protein 15-like isoform X2 n=1 Tax=Leguminivora glycinivorella TaxID=1035111 RepID=UPI00200E15BA|nr:sporulation-specific protein 15-like isoform X2 [Leguminivora glycinivorella]
MSSNNLTKSPYEKDQNDNNMCKKHASRCDKDYYRSVCPSKLSKRELEDLYYSLQENNLELKRTINAQTEKNRILSTKVQRMTSQSKVYTSKDCCAAAKAIINEQREGIADLTKANEALAERIRKLSTQLCTAKQFLKQVPSNRGCYKCFATTTNSNKVQSTVSLQNKSSASNLKSAAVSTTQIEQESPSTKMAETNTLENYVEHIEKKDPETVCNENKCRTMVEQFKQKIADLEEVSELQSAVLRARSEHNLLPKDSLELVRGLRKSDAEKAELETQLSVEKSKVVELEMQLKAAEISQQVAKTVESHLSNNYQLEEKQLRETSIERCSACSNKMTMTGDTTDTSPRPAPSTSTKTPNELTVPDDKLSKSDDSGYADHRQETDNDEKNNTTNQELMKKIEEIQAQLDALQLARAENDSDEQESLYYKTYHYYQKSDNDPEFVSNPARVSVSRREAAFIKLPRVSVISNKSAKIMTDNEKNTNTTALDNEKLNMTTETNTHFKDGYPYKEIFVVNDGIIVTNGSNADKRNESHINNSPQQDETGPTVECNTDVDNTDLEPNTLTENNEVKSPETSLSHTANKEHQLNYPKEIEQGDSCLNSLQNEVEIVHPKPVSYYNSNTNSEQDSNIRRASIVRTSKPLLNKDDDFHHTPEFIPINDSAKRRLSLTKKKPKLGGKKKMESVKEQSKEGKNKSVSKRDKKPLGKHDQKDAKETRKKDINEIIGLHDHETERPNSQEFEKENLPLNVTNKTNDTREIAEHGSILKAPIGSSTPKAEMAQTSPRTYTIEEKAQDSRPSSPENTEHEISVMTDLPSEIDDAYDRLSPGEHRTIATSTETTPRQGYTLSEGEVPVNLERRTSKSLGEVRRSDYAKEDSSFGEKRSSTQKMEATLKVISQELARCRSLLQTQRPREVT